MEGLMHNAEDSRTATEVIRPTRTCADLGIRWCAVAGKTRAITLNGDVELQFALNNRFAYVIIR
jgi:hypothetical protein